MSSNFPSPDGGSLKSTHENILKDLQVTRDAILENVDKTINKLEGFASLSSSVENLEKQQGAFNRVVTKADGKETTVFQVVQQGTDKVKQVAASYWVDRNGKLTEKTWWRRALHWIFRQSQIKELSLFQLKWKVNAFEARSQLDKLGAATLLDAICKHICTKENVSQKNKDLFKDYKWNNFA